MCFDGGYGLTSVLEFTEEAATPPLKSQSGLQGSIDLSATRVKSAEARAEIV